MLNIAVLGLGAWGMRHVRSAAASGRFNVVKGVDKVTPDVDFPVTASLDEVLDDPTIDAVSIATPHTLHAGQIRRAAMAGKHILTEKPFALSHEDALANVEVTRENGVVLALGHDQRFYPAVNAMRVLLAEGAFGRVATAQSVLSHDFTRKALDRLNAQAVAAGSAGKGGEDWWRMNLAEAPVGPMVHLGIHHVDLFIHLFGRIDWVLASSPAPLMETPFPDTMLVTLGFSGGQVGTINSSLASPLNSRLLVSGSDGWAELVGPDDLGSYQKSSLCTMKGRFGSDDPAARDFPLIDSVAANFAAFADAIEGRAPYPVPVEDMLHNAQVLEALVASSRSGAIEQVGT